MRRPRKEDIDSGCCPQRADYYLSCNHQSRTEWLQSLIDHVDQTPKTFQPVIQDFNAMVENSPRLYLLVRSMFEQVPNKEPYLNDPAGSKQVRDFYHMLQLLNHLITRAPPLGDGPYGGIMVGLPICCVLHWPMGTPSGFAFFLDPAVNNMLRRVLDTWGEFLTTEESAKQALSKGRHGWLSNHGIAELSHAANAAAGTMYSFAEMFNCDPSKPYHGFASWDDFFTRTFKEGIRPVAAPEDDNVIANACESQPYAHQYDCKLRDQFWIKGQPYSVSDMLAHDPVAAQFEGCTVYQAFLSSMSYHRWHAPLSGTVVNTLVVQGTYYSQPLFVGLKQPEDMSSPSVVGEPENMSSPGVVGEPDAQSYLSAMATRAIIYIQADNPAIGLMAFLAVGMADVSTCEITVVKGQHINKGDETGMFHYGGSTYCLMFRKGVDVRGFPQAGTLVNIPVNSQIAVVDGRNKLKD